MTQSTPASRPTLSRNILIGIAALAVLLTLSSNVVMWLAVLSALFIAVWLVGGRKAYPVLPWIAFMFWIQIAGDLIANDFLGQDVGKLAWLGPFWQQAIFYSLSALLALVFGMRSGVSVGRRVFGTSDRVRVPDDWQENGGVKLQRAVALYFISFLLTAFGYRYAWMVPGLTQELVALTLLKYVCIYLVAAKTFEINRDRHWLIGVALLEFGSGLISYFASYKEPIFIIMLAMISSGRRLSAGQYLTGFFAVVTVIWVSLVWTVIKADYRNAMGSMTTDQQIAWISDRYLSADVDYANAFLRLSQRVGYTSLFSDVLAEESSGGLPTNFNFYTGAVEHILTPRFLFPDKAALDDSRLTTLLLGANIAAGTSVGVGYVTQAYVDFGYPGMLVPIWVIGLMLGVAAQYFLTRGVPLVIRYAFGTSVLFIAFPFAGNIDKELGMFVTNLVVLVLVLKIAYPALARWLAGASVASGGQRQQILVPSPLA